MGYLVLSQMETITAEIFKVFISQNKNTGEYVWRDLKICWKSAQGKLMWHEINLHFEWKLFNKKKHIHINDAAFFSFRTNRRVNSRKSDVMIGKQKYEHGLEIKNMKMCSPRWWLAVKHGPLRTAHCCQDRPLNYIIHHWLSIHHILFFFLYFIFISSFVSSVRSSNSHPDLLVTHHHHPPTFSDHTGPQHWTFTFWATTAI